MIIITYFDLKRLFFRHFSKIKFTAIFCGLAVFGVLLLANRFIGQMQPSNKQASGMMFQIT